MKITPKNFAIASKEILKIFCLQSFAYLSKIVRYSLLLGIASHQACLFTSSSTMNIKDQKTTMSTKTETGGWKTVKHDQTCVKQKISSRSHKQNKAFRQVIIWLPIRKQIACWLVSNSGYHCGMKTIQKKYGVIGFEMLYLWYVVVHHLWGLVLKLTIMLCLAHHIFENLKLYHLYSQSWQLAIHFRKGNLELPLNLMRILTQAFPACLKKMDQVIALLASSFIWGFHHNAIW